MTECEKVADCKPGCKYAGTIGHDPCCDYILITGNKRPCPGGPDCAEWTPAAPGPKKPQPITIGSRRGRRDWDKAKAREIYDAGGSQREIAEACGVVVNTVAKWLKSEGLEPNGLKSPPPQPQPATEPEPPAVPGDLTSVRLPNTEVSISITLGNSTASVRADNVGAAREVIGNLQDILTAIVSGLK